MNNYIFKTTATMKEYNARKYWIDTNIINEIRIQAKTTADALEMWREKVIDRDYIDISKNALKTKAPMYIDRDGKPAQIGYVITASTDFDKGNYTGYTKHFIDLWVEVLKLAPAEF